MKNLFSSYPLRTVRCTETLLTKNEMLLCRSNIGLSLIQFQVQQQQQPSAQDTLKSVNGYHESLIEALRNAAAATSSSQRGSNSSNSFGLGAGGGGANTGGAGSNHRSSAASLTVSLCFDLK